MKNKFISLFVLFFLFNSLFLNPTLIRIDNNDSEPTLSNTDSEPTLSNTNKPFDQPTTTNLSQPEQPQITQSVDYDTWYLGESMYVNAKYMKNYPDFYRETVESLTVGVTISVENCGGFENIENDDGKSYYVYLALDSSYTQAYFKIYMDIYTQRSGSFNTKFMLETKSSAAEDKNSTWITAYSLDKYKADADGYLHYYWIFGTDATNQDSPEVTMKLYQYKGSDTTLIKSSVQTVGYLANVKYFWFCLDYFYHTPSDSIGFIRNEYKYLSPESRAVRLNFHADTSMDYINIYYDSERYIYENVYPFDRDGGVTIYSSYIHIDVNYEDDYTVFFTSNSTNYLTIKDVSSTYLEDIGFEKGSTSDIISNTFDTTFEVSSDIVSEGYFSLFCSDSDSSSDDINFLLNYRGYMYVSFDYFVPSCTWTDIRVYYRLDDSTWDYQLFNIIDTTSWHKAFAYIYIGGIDSTLNRDFFIRGTTGSGEVYIDNLHFFVSSTEVETLEPSKYEITSTLISWDGYQNPTMPNADVCFQLNKRTFYDENRIYGSYDKTLFDVTARTDENGIATYTYSGGLQQEEYELVSWSPDSFFAPDIDITNYEKIVATGEQFWVLSYEKAGTETTTLIETEKGSTIKFEFQYDVGGHGSAYIIFKLANTLDDFNGFPIDFAYFYLRSNVSSSEHVIQRTYMVDEWSAETSRNETDTLPTSDFTLIRWDYNHFDSTNPAYDREELFEYLDFWYSPAGYTGGITIEYANFHFVHAQKYYFTPSPVSETDFAEKELNDAWDWTEGDTEDFIATGGGIWNNVENGYVNFSVVNEWDGIKILNLDENITGTTYYTAFIFRARGNESKTNFWGVWFGLDLVNQFNFYTHEDTDLYTEWHTYVYLFKDATGYTSGEAFDEIRLHAYLGTFNVEVQIDFAKVVHIDSWLEETNDYATDTLSDAWDFNEGDKEGWSPYSWVSDTIQNGYWEKTSNTAWSKYYIDNIESFNESHYTTVVFRIWSNVSQTLVFTQKTGGLWGTKIKETNLPIIADVWTVFTASINQTYDIDCFIINTDGNDTPKKVRLDYIRLMHLEYVPYTMIDTSVLLESETNDLQYSLWVDYSFIGSFSDLSLIPLIQTTGTHYLQIQPYKTNQAYLTQNIYSYYYTVTADAFAVSLQSFYLSDTYVNTYVTSNYNGSYTVYENSVFIDSGTLYKEGTTIITNRNVTAGASINYTIVFTHDSETVIFKTWYNNPSSDFYVTNYSVDINTTITVTWDTSKSSIDSLTVIEDGVTKVSSDTASPSSWTKSIVTGDHIVTLIFSATDYNDIIYSFSYTVAEIESFLVSVESFYLSDDYVNLYCTANKNYNYTAYTNGTETGSGNGFKEGTFIVIPKNKTAGIFNLTIIFTNDTDSVSFMTWYSNLIPPPEPQNDIYRESSQGFYNITLVTNLNEFWIDLYHDGVLIVNDSNETFFSIEKALKVGWHNITFDFIYPVYTDLVGEPLLGGPINETITYTFWYEVVQFFESYIRYVPMDLGLAIGSFEASWVKTYLDGELVERALITDLDDYSNYSFISFEEIFIRNTESTHRLEVFDLFDRLILNTTINLSSFKYHVIELPIYRLGVVNLDDESHILGIKPYLTTELEQQSPELASGQFIEFWVCNRTYEFTVYSVMSTFYDATGALIKIWEEDPTIPIPPSTVPITITIPVNEETSSRTSSGTSLFANPLFWIIVIGTILFALISYYAKKTKTKLEEKLDHLGKKITISAQKSEAKYKKGKNKSTKAKATKKTNRGFGF